MTITAIVMVLMLSIAGLLHAEETGQTTCPVMEGTPVDRNLYTEYQGKRVYFCCEMCKQTFLNDPIKYVSKLPQFLSNTNVEADNHGTHSHGDEHATLKTNLKSSFSAYSLVKPLGIVTFASLLVTVLLGLFRRKLRRRFLILHRTLAFLTLGLATIHAALIFLLH